MAANKRRKLNELAGSKNISAFAARKQLQFPHNADESGFKTTSITYESPVNSEEGRLFNSNSILTSGVFNQEFQGGIGQEPDRNNENDGAESGIISDSDEDDEELKEITSSKNSRETGHLHPSYQSWTQLTTVNLSKSNAERFKDGTLRIRIGPGEKLVVLGEYGLSVIRGQITILGAILSASRTIHDVCASSSHSLPVLRFSSSDTEKAEILLHESHSKLRSLRQLSPLFAGLWSMSSSHLEPSDKAELKHLRSTGSSFQILLRRDGIPHMGHYPMVSPPEWNELLSKCASERSRDGKSSVTMICGPKSSGKSTFSRLLTNRLLTISQAQGADSSVAFLDLDPGQPEFSPPGQLSLLLLSNPNFGPPFSHPYGSKTGAKLIRAHSISAVSPSSDPAFYTACAKDLLSCYLSLLLPIQYPLVINTPGWILGTGLELLTGLIKEARPTHVIYMSKDGPHEVVESLQSAAKSTPVLTLPSQPTENLPRTSAHLRTMQYISYFHLDLMNPGNCIWNLSPITSMAPLEVDYAGKAAGILGIMCLGEKPSARMLRDTIDGSLVAVVVIEDVAALLSSRCNENMEESNPGQSREDISMIMGNSNEDVVKLRFTEQSHLRREISLIQHSPEGIPYFNPTDALSLDPSCSYTIGLAIVRGIDVRKQRLQLLTPILTDSIKDIKASGKAIVLVSGKLDTPGWAYLEAFYKKDADLKEDNTLRESDEMKQDSGDEDEDGDVAADHRDHRAGFENVPWVEVLQGDKGREVGARVWRVRRDLGKTGGGD